MSCDFLTLATPGVATLQPYQPGKPVEELQRELGLKDIVKLASNENPLGPGERAMEVLRRPKEIARYPDGNGFKLKARLAKYHGMSADRITLGNGSNEILELITRAIVQPHHEVVFSDHAFAVYPLVTQAVGAKPVVVQAKDWAHDSEAMAAAVTANTRLMFVANPNNPTGTWIKRNELTRLLETVPDHVIVVVDEAYFDYAVLPDYPDCSTWLDIFPNLLVTRTFSKAHGLAALRIGYSLSHPEIADLLNRVRQPFNVNALALAAAEVSIDDRKHIEKSIQANQDGMNLLTSAFDEMGLPYLPSAGNFVCVDLQRPGREIFNQLLRKGVIVRPVDNYGMPNHIRVTIGIEHENKKFIAALKKVLTS